MARLDRRQARLTPCGGVGLTLTPPHPDPPTFRQESEDDWPHDRRAAHARARRPRARHGAADAPRPGRKPQAPGGRSGLVKIVCLGVIDAMAVYAILVLLTKDSVVIAAVVALGILAINVVYLKPGLLPAKYLTPGLVFLFVFQIFVVLYCIYIAFTNYGSGHVSTKDDAVNALLIQNQQRVEDSAAYPMSVLEKDGAPLLPRDHSRRHRRDRQRRPAARGGIGCRVHGRPRGGASRVHHLELRSARGQPGDDLVDGGAVLHRSQRRHAPNPRRLDGLPVRLHARVGCRRRHHDEHADGRRLHGQRQRLLRLRRWADPRHGMAGLGRRRQLRPGVLHRVDPWALPRRAHLDVRVRHPLGGDDLRARPVPRDRVQRSRG